MMTPPSRIARLLRALVLAAAAGAVLLGVVWSGPDVPAVARLVTRPQGYVDTVGAVEAVRTLLGAVAWLLLAWLAAATALATVAVLPGAVGRFGVGVARWTLPYAVRRLLAAALGVGVLAAATGCGTQAPSARYSAADWPAASASSGASGAAPSAAGAVVEWPPGAVPTSTPTGADPSAVVIVAPGDTLWAIAAAHLPVTVADAEIAHAVTAWHAANHAVVGADPDLIRPGQHLLPPESHPETEPIP